MSIVKSITLTGVPVYYAYTGAADKFGKYSATVGLTKEHVNQLLEAGLSEKVMNPKTNAILDRFRTGKVMNADKEILYEGIVGKFSKTTPVRVEHNKQTFTGIIGNGSTCDVRISLNKHDEDSPLSPKLTGIRVTNLVEYAGGETDSFFEGEMTNEEVTNRLNSL